MKVFNKQKCRLSYIQLKFPLFTYLCIFLCPRCSHDASGLLPPPYKNLANKKHGP